MKHEKIIRKVKSKLTGNFKDDKKFLISQYKKYRKHPKKEEIYIKIIDVLYDSLDEGVEKIFLRDMINFSQLTRDVLSDEDKKEFDLEFSQLIFDSLFDDDIDLNSVVFDDVDINSVVADDEEFETKFTQLFSDDGSEVAGGEFTKLFYTSLTDEDKKIFKRVFNSIIHDSLSDVDKEEFGNELDQILLNALSGEANVNLFSSYLNSIKKVLDCFDYLSDQENVEESFNYLDGFFNEIDDFVKNESQVEYHYFDNLIEESLFNEYFKTSKKIVIVPKEYSVLNLYYIYGVTLIEYDELDKAAIVFKKALEFNPVSVDTIFELIEIYESEKDFESILPLIKEGLKFAYLEEDLARFYEELGKYYMEKLDFNLVYASFKASLEYLDDSALISVLEEISDVFRVDEDFVKVLESENIPYGPNPFILDTLKDLAEKAESDKEIEDAIHFNKLSYALTSDKKFRKKISSLKRKL